MWLKNTSKVLVAQATEKLINNSPLSSYLAGLAGNSVLVSCRLIGEDILTSAMVEQLECDFCDTRFGAEELTWSLPNVGENDLVNLDERGTVKVGTIVKRGDILVGKARPRGRSEYTAEEKMLIVTFGAKITDIDASLRWDREDSGLVTRVEIASLRHYRCTQCDKWVYVDATSLGWRCSCGGELTLIPSLPFPVPERCFAAVRVEVLVRRALAVGDVLTDNDGRGIVVAGIIPDILTIDTSPARPIDMLVLPDSPLATQLRDKRTLRGIRRKSFDKTRFDEVKLKKTTLTVEDKIVARGVGAYSLFTLMPFGNDRAQLVLKETALTLFKNGLGRNLAEICSAKSDLNVGPGVYETLFKGGVITPAIPESVNILHNNLTALAVKTEYLDAEGETIDWRPDNFNPATDAEDISYETLSRVKSVRLVPATSEDIRKISYGIVKRSETINFRTFRPERGGLFCEKIFGSVRSWECACGRYKKEKYRGIICDRCGVEVSDSIVRRYRFGHIELAMPVVNPLYLESLGELLDMSESVLKEIVYGASWVVTTLRLDLWGDLTDEVRKSAEKENVDFAEAEALIAWFVNLSPGDLLGDEEYASFGYADRLTGGKLSEAVNVRIQAQAIRELLLAKGLEPDGFVLDALLVLPPELRPMFELDNGRFATSDLNDLYRRIINRSNRTEKLAEIKAPVSIILHEARLLQESVDQLFINEMMVKPVVGSYNRPLRSLAAQLEDAVRRMTEKRVNYCAKGVVVPDNILGPGQIGLPVRAAIEMYQPLLLGQVVRDGTTSNIKTAKRLVDGKFSQVRSSLESVIAERPVIVVGTSGREVVVLQPVLTDNEALTVHPDTGKQLKLWFGGETLTLHLPLSKEAVEEAKQPQKSQSRRDCSSAIASLNTETIIEHALSKEPIKLSKFDRALVGIVE